MNKYPFVYFLRTSKYSGIDNFIEQNKDKLECTVEIIGENDLDKLNNLFDNSKYHILVTFGDSDKEYIPMIMPRLVDRMRNRWFHRKTIDNLGDFNKNVNCCFVFNAIMNREDVRPKFSIFTTCYNSYDKIYRAYDGLKKQLLRDWEWVILDDSPDDKHFTFLRELSQKDKRIRLYNRDGNSGSIGHVKNEAVSLCRGKYVLELDHDDIILPDLLKDTFEVFESDKEIGFVFTDFANVYEDWRNFNYGEHLGKGNVCYYKHKFDGKWLDVCSCPGINNITTSHLICLPNHPRMWRRKVLLELGNYSEFLPICDDFEILLRTMCHTKVAKIHKLGYIQFMNNDNNNFSLIRNGEINRLGPKWIRPMFYEMYKVNDTFKQRGAYEDEKYIEKDMTQIWKRKDYEHKVCSVVSNPNYDKQYCLLGIDALNDKRISELYKNSRNDFMLLSNKISSDDLVKELEKRGYDRMKCFGLSEGTTDSEMVRYFELICKYTENYELIGEYEKDEEPEISFEVNGNSINEIGRISSNYKEVEEYHEPINNGGLSFNLNSSPETISTKKREFDSRFSIINKFSKKYKDYLEIGVEYGQTFENIQIQNKVGVDPDPKTPDPRIIKKTSDEFFVDNNKNYDVIFIDGMHQAEYVLRDFNNSVKCLNKGGLIFLDDVLPINEREQNKIPIKHAFENGILKYREPWTGDVWKFVYYLLKNKGDKLNHKVFTHQNYRGVLKLEVKDNIEISPTMIEEIEKFDYNKDFNEYKNLLMTNTLNTID